MERVFSDRRGRGRYAHYVVAVYCVLQILGLVFHAGSSWFRYVAFAVLPVAWVGSDPVTYMRVTETAHAFLALGVAEEYEEAFSKALAFSVRDARLERHEDLCEEEVSSYDFPKESQDALRRAGISSSEEKTYLQEPLRRLRSCEALRRTMLDAQLAAQAAIDEKIALGMPFRDIARYFSGDVSSQDDGMLGERYLRDLPKDWVDRLGVMREGEIGNKFLGDTGFWTLKVLEKGGKGGDAWIRLQGILVPYPSVDEVILATFSQENVFLMVW